MGCAGKLGWTASVVIPAFQEVHALPRCLESLLAQDLGGIRLHVVVSVNGPSDGTAEVARAAAGEFADRGHRLDVIVSKTASKALALNAGDDATDVFPRLYLDADVLLSPDAIRRTVEELRAAQGPALAAPTIRVRPGRSTFARSYGRVWNQLPNIQSQVIGAGFYAVNRAGRARWWRFPAELGCDDKFVRLQFERSEMIVLRDAWFEVFLPETFMELIRVRGRWTSLNQDLDRRCPSLARRDRGRWRTSVIHALGHPSTYPAVPIFALVWFLGRVSAGLGRNRTNGWARSTSSPIRLEDPATRPVPAAPGGRVPAAPDDIERDDRRAPPPRTVQAVVVTHNSVDHIQDCVRALLASTDLDSIEVAVVDNASVDGTTDLLRGTFPEVTVRRNGENAGFARAVNQAAACADTNWVAVINPDVVVNPDTLSTIVAALEARRELGLGTVPARTIDGAISDRSFLSFPTLWSEIALAAGLHRLDPGSRLCNPEQYRAYHPFHEPTGVDALAGCLTVVDRSLWTHLDGYDERYFLCGEDLDLSRRAINAGAAPIVVPAKPIVHASEHSFASPADSRIAYLRGREEFEQQWWPWSHVAAGNLVRRLAIGVRALVASTTGRGNTDAQAVWGRRSEWSGPAATWTRPRRHTTPSQASPRGSLRPLESVEAR